METTALLVPKDELKKYLDQVYDDEKAIVEDLKRIVPYVQHEKLLKSLSKRLQQGEACLVALEAGFVPVSSGWFTRTDVKTKWQKRWVDDTLESMPEQVKEIWDKVKEKGVFDSFSVTTRGGGDPLLVGNKGGKHFVIAGWLPITPKTSLGFRIKLP